MRYVPNLIPKDKKVRPDYFKGSPYVTQSKNKIGTLLSYIGAVSLFLAALACINHSVLTLLLGILGFILLPQGHQWLEQKLRFNLTHTVKSTFSITLFILSLPLFSYYSDIDKQEDALLQIKKQQEAQEKLVAEKKEAQRKDSINTYIEAASTFAKDNKIEAALSKLSYIASFSPTEEEKEAIEKAKNNVLLQKTFSLVRSGNYQAALPELNRYLSIDPSNAELLYNRALCYSKIGSIAEAVNDAKAAMELGHSGAEKLHDKINPIRKVIVGYVTRCCDGSTSYARGRGACSHHGGVCNWNDPVYEEYRKY